MTGNYRPEHLFALQEALALYVFYTDHLAACDTEIERQFANLKPISDDLPPLPLSAKRDSHSKNAPSYDARSYLYRLTGVDLVAISRLNENTVQKIISEVGTYLRAFPTESTSAPGWVWRRITTSRRQSSAQSYPQTNNLVVLAFLFSSLSVS